MTVHFPWSKQVLLQAVTLDDGASVQPVQKKKLLMYGDSITAGCYATRPSNRLAARVAAALDMEECNRAMSGSRFLPELAAIPDPVKPDLITVAYGSNDWAAGKTASELTDHCRQFLQNLCRNYPGVGIFLISPIWRSNFDCSNPCMDYQTVTESIWFAAAEFDNVIFISGSELLPRDETLLFDRLHPNDKGFEIYAGNLTEKLRAHL